MTITVEISLYPLDKEYKEHVINFIKAMNTYHSLITRTTAMSTYVIGEFSEVMQMLTKELAIVYKHIPNSSTIVKIIPQELEIEVGYLEF